MVLKINMNIIRFTLVLPFFCCLPIDHEPEGERSVRLNLMRLPVITQPNDRA